MRFISTKTHGILDYTWAILLILSPWIINYANVGTAQVIALAFGIAVLLMAIVTNYELVVIRKLPMPTHLALDVLVGVFLAASPWIFGFANQVFIPHLLFGLFSIVAGFVTKRSPSATHILLNG